MKKLIYIIKQLILSFVLILPNTYFFCKLRAKYYRFLGCKIGQNVSIAANVRITGNVEIGNHSSIAQNCTLSGRKIGIFIGDYVMVAPGCVFVAFDHSFDDLYTPMIKQKEKEASIIVEEDVWIAANCTITKGVILKKGVIIAANSVVTKNTEKNGIYGGVPAKLIKRRVQL